MKLRYILVLFFVPLLFSTSSFASKLDFDHEDSQSIFKHHVEDNDEIKLNLDDEIKSFVHYLKDNHNVYIYLCHENNDNHHGQDNGHHNNSDDDNGHDDGGGIGEVPVPGALWLFGSALLGVMSLKRRK
jgi:hypothetical protein